MLIAGSVGLIIVALGANAFFSKSNDNVPIALVDEPSSLVYEAENEQGNSDTNYPINDDVQASTNYDDVDTSAAIVAAHGNVNIPTFEDTPTEPVFQDIAPPAATVKREVEKVDVYQPPSNQAQNNQSYEAAVSNTVPAAQAYKPISI